MQGSTTSGTLRTVWLFSYSKDTWVEQRVRQTRLQIETKGLFTDFSMMGIAGIYFDRHIRRMKKGHLGHVPYRINGQFGRLDEAQ